VTFERPLTNKNDITLFARQTTQINADETQINADMTIEVYAEGGTEVIAKFPTITVDKMYKVFLTNLNTPTDTFDLKIVNSNANNANNHANNANDANSSSSTNYSLPTTSSIDIDFIVDPTHGLVGYWKFDETSGTTANDSSGYGNTGTHTNGPTISTTVPTTSFANPRSLSFDGVDDQIKVLNSNSVNIAGNMSASFWVKISTPIQQGVPLFKDFQYSLLIRSSLDLTWADSSNWSYDSFRDHPSGMSSNTWHHIAVTKNGSTVTIYRDNAVVVAKTFGGAITQTSNDLYFGIYAAGQGSPFSGLIDDVRIYNRALSASEISALAAGGHTTATWTGTTNTNYETGTNWDTGAVPDPYTNVVIANTTNKPILSANQEMASLTINSGATLNLNGFNLTQNDGGTFTNNGTLIMKGTETLTGFTMDTTNGTVMYTNTTNQTGLNGGNTYNNLTLNDGLVGYWKLDAGSGTTATDSSGYGNNGTLTNGPTWSSTVPSAITFTNPYSLSFDGVNDYVSVGAVISPTLTVSAWVKVGTINSSYRNILTNLTVGGCILKTVNSCGMKEKIELLEVPQYQQMYGHML
jgi:hypothetical protein